MPTPDVILGARYKHDGTGREMVLEAASVPELNNRVLLVVPEMFGIPLGYFEGWRGTWADFKANWTLVSRDWRVGWLSRMERRNWIENNSLR